MLHQLDFLQPIEWKKSLRAKYISLRIRPNGTLLITLPFWKGPKSALPFVLEKQDWIIRARKKLENRQVNALKVNQSEIPQVRKQAKSVLGSRLEALAGEYGFHYTGVRFQWMKSRWGSCSPHNSISLNLALIYLPKELQDYVILHELCHTRVKNHGKGFWSLLDEYTNHQAKQLARKMKEYKIGDIEQ